MKKIVITGATGAIGRALITEAIQSGYEVLAVVHRSSGRAERLDKIRNCSVLRLDLSEYKNAIEEMEIQGLTANYDIFFHLAWEAPFGNGRNNYELQLNNVQAAIDAVDFAKKLGCQVFVGTGSQAEYGRVERTIESDKNSIGHSFSSVQDSLLLRSNTPTNPETGYGIAKLCAGQMTRLAAEQYGMKHIWTRILSVYGPHDRAETLISTAVSKMLRNEKTEFSPCEQIWDYLYEEDAARALLLAGEKGIHGKNYVVGSGEAHPLRWYIEKIAEITGYRKDIGFGRRPYNDKQVMHLVADISELEGDTGFRPKVDFETGIREMISV
ncbi:MAG: NAD(P)-dependent oxidoreductase [Eubacterium sp.]|nr:NAD(P)-dependent oxidoreductase [Eubacterium sp.]